MRAPESTAFHCQMIEPIASAYFNFQRNSLKNAADSTSAYSGFTFGSQPIPLWRTVDSTFHLVEMTAKRVELTVSQSGIHNVVGDVRNPLKWGNAKYSLSQAFLQ